jgi:hypothetical protein
MSFKISSITKKEKNQRLAYSRLVSSSSVRLTLPNPKTSAFAKITPEASNLNKKWSLIL